MYAKVFKQLWAGTLYGRRDEQLVFIFLLCHADSKGVVDIHPRAISGFLGMDEPAVVKALAGLEAADFKSRSDEAQGSRIVRLDEHRDWGWCITNYLKYRNVRDDAARKYQNQESQQRHRDKDKGSSARVSTRQQSQQRQHSSAQEEVEVEGEVEAKAESQKHLVPDGTVRESAKREKTPEQIQIEKNRKDWRESFDEFFWPTYQPLRAGLPNPRTDALAEWLKVTHPTQELFNSVQRDLRASIMAWSDTEPQYIPHARKWLHERIRGGVYGG